jgi:hypothetical protein
VADKCEYCGGDKHSPVACPLVRSVEFFPDGSVKKVEKYDRNFTPTFGTTTSVSGWPSNITISTRDDGPESDKEEPH